MYPPLSERQVVNSAMVSSSQPSSPGLIPGADGRRHHPLIKTPPLPTGYLPQQPSYFGPGPLASSGSIMVVSSYPPTGTSILPGTCVCVYIFYQVVLCVCIWNCSFSNNILPIVGVAANMTNPLPPPPTSSASAGSLTTAGGRPVTTSYSPTMLPNASIPSLNGQQPLSFTRLPRVIHTT